MRRRGPQAVSRACRRHGNPRGSCLAFGFAGKKQVGMRPKETTMGYSAVGCLVTLTLSLLAVPLAADAQPSTKVARIGYLLGTTQEQEPLLEAFLEAMRALGYV